MNEEEKETIEYLKECILKEHTFEEELTLSFMAKAVNLIEKQQAEIEDCKKCILRDEVHNYIEEIEKKDKIIEAMANFILVLVPNRYYDEKPPAIMDIDWVKQYFERRIEQ